MANYSVHRQFIVPEDVVKFRNIAACSSGWHPGRQGTGYDILSLKKMAGAPFDRARQLIGVQHDGAWDAYLIRYNDGSFIPPHRDDASFGLRHRRLNVLVTAPISGGELLIGGILVSLAEGDGVMFHPNEDEHSVEPVVGERLLFSVGAWVER